MNNLNILPRKQGHGNPTMHETKSVMLDVHVAWWKFSNYNLTQNFIPKFMAIKTSNSMTYVNWASSLETYVLSKIFPSAKMFFFKQVERNSNVNLF